jgi:hypothetical protein
VLPTSGKEFRPIQLRSSAAGKKIRPHTVSFLRAVLQALLPQISSKNSGVNPWVGQSISSNNQDLYVKYTHQKSSATFLPFFRNRPKIQPLRFLWDHFCVLRPKFGPVGNTGHKMQNGFRCTHFFFCYHNYKHCIFFNFYVQNRPQILPATRFFNVLSPPSWK